MDINKTSSQYLNEFFEIHTQMIHYDNVFLEEFFIDKLIEFRTDTYRRNYGNKYDLSDISDYRTFLNINFIKRNQEFILNQIIERFLALLSKAHEKNLALFGDFPKNAEIIINLD